MSTTYFTVTQQHIDLLRNTYLRWDDTEFGAPAIDPKRPYGNNSVYSDIAEILNIKPQGEDDAFTDEQEETMHRLHKETLTALIIVLSTGAMKPGAYQYQDNSWHWVGKKKQKETMSEPEIDIPPGVGVERFLAMINERGLSSSYYTESRYSTSLGSHTTDLIDVLKDGKVLATYDTVVTQYFTERTMASELDGLIKEQIKE